MRLHFAILALSLAGLIAAQEISPQKNLTESVSFKFNEGFPTFSARSIEFMSFGYARIFSNLLWLRFMQHTPPARVPENEVSWIYLDLDAISNIDPDFLPTFEQGGIFLSVVTTDKEGARLLLEKGAKLHPDRWRLFSHLGYHYQFELHELDKAGEAYQKASQIPGAPPVFSEYAKKYNARKTSPLENIKFLENMKRSTKDELIQKRLQDKIDYWKQKLLEQKNE